MNNLPQYKHQPHRNQSGSAKWPKAFLGAGIAASLAGGMLLGALPARADSNTNTAETVTGAQLYNGGTAAPGSSYTRLIRLEHSGSANGHLLATHEDFDAAAFPVYESDNDGANWTAPISTVSEQHDAGAGWHFTWQPHLFEVPQQMGNLAAGTVLLAGTSVGPGGFRIELYASTDQGHTWTYRSQIDTSEGAQHGGIYEPDLQIASDGSLMVYYSDERQVYNQALVEKRSTDGGQTWDPTPTNVVAIDSNTGLRPGMAVTAKLPDGRYVMSFEDVGSPEGASPVHIKYSNDGITWTANDEGIHITTPSGSFLGATPYIMWSPGGGANGSLFVSAQFLENSPNTDRELMVSYDLGNTWTMMPSPVQWNGGSQPACPGGAAGPGGWDHAGWSQAMLPTADGTGIIHMASSYIGNCLNEIRYGRETVLVPNQAYNLINAHSNLAIDIPGGVSTPTRLEQYTRNNNPAQTFTFQDLGNNRYVVVNPQSQLAWDDPSGTNVPGTVLQVYNQDGATAQQWQLRAVGDGSWKFLNVASQLVMAVDNQDTNPGASITEWSDNNTPDHNWFPVAAGAP